MPNDNTQTKTDDQKAVDSSMPPIIFSEDAVPPTLQQNPIQHDVTPATPTVVDQQSGSAAPANDVVMDTVMPAVVTSSPKKKFAGGKIIATILGLFLLVGGVGAGVFLTSQNQDIREKASGECGVRYYCKNDKTVGTTSSLYDPSTNMECDVAEPNTCNNNLNFYLPGQTTGRCYGTQAEAQADPVCASSDNSPVGVDVVFSCIPGRAGVACLNLNATWDGSTCVLNYCPRGDTDGDRSCNTLDSGATAEAGSCTEMLNRVTTFSPNQCYQIDTVVSMSDNRWCDLTKDRGSYCNGYQSNLGTCMNVTATPTASPSTPPTTPPNITAQCQNIKAYSSTWTLLTATDLSRLSTGSVVNFCAAGVTSGGSFDKGKFTINGTVQAETMAKRPSSNDYCQTYTIPTGTRTFSVTAQLHHVTLGWK